ncbi:MAG: hypothetical protein ACUVRL_08710 [Candidatus Saccharicenans sp.]|uniref:hypothetical protein n=1 Tax=Candidatus Saccharicenans sp. TaxID=2819258 RepID=UPI00404A5841
MKKNPLVLILALGLMFGLWTLTSAQQQAYKSQWAAELRMIDGQENDWEGASFQNFKKARVDYAVAHDGQYLYLVMVFHNEAGLSTADETGVYVYLSQANKKNKDIGFHFVKKAISAEEAIARMEAMGETLSEERKAQIREKKMLVLYEGEPVGKKFKADLQKIQGQKFEPAVFRGRIDKPGRGPGAAAQGQSGFKKAVFEFRIPLRPSPALPPLIEPGKPLNLGIEWGGMTEQRKQELMARRAAAATRATATDSRMVVSGDEPSEGGFDRGGGDIDMKNLPKKFNFWFGLVVSAQ